MKSTFLNAVAKKNTEHIPVWFMRQAGRYLPEYMKLKEVHPFRTRTHTPDLMAEITMQPMRRYPFDAAIMFSDILTCLEYMGAAFDFTGEGPRLATAGVSTLKEIRELDIKDMSFVFEGIQKIRSELGNDRPLLGFAGAPFTLCSYIIEGGTSKDFLKTKNFMYSSPKEFHKAMEILSTSIGNYLAAQMQEGVAATQIFDSWVGFLNEDDYRNYLLPHMKHLMSLARKGGKPITLYSQPCSHLLPALKEVGADVYSVDWRIKLKDAAHILGDVAIQGNLDPAVTTLDWAEAKPFVDQVLNDMKEAGIRNRYIFNVGHGVNPSTKPETVAAIIDYVHQQP